MGNMNNRFDYAGTIGVGLPIGRQPVDLPAAALAGKLLHRRAHARRVPGREAQRDAAGGGNGARRGHHRDGEPPREMLFRAHRAVRGGKDDHTAVHQRETTFPARFIRSTMSYMLLTVPTWSLSAIP